MSCAASSEYSRRNRRQCRPSRRLDGSKYRATIRPEFAILENGSAKRLRAGAHRSAFDRGRCRFRASLSRGAVIQGGASIRHLAIARDRFVIARRKLQHTLAIVNVPESTIAREVEAVLHTYAGAEIALHRQKLHVPAHRSCCFGECCRGCRMSLARVNDTPDSHRSARTPTISSELEHRLLIASADTP